MTEPRRTGARANPRRIEELFLVPTQRLVKGLFRTERREADLDEALRAGCPSGIDVVLENARAEHLCACLPLMKELKQVLIAGFVGTCNLSSRIGLPRNF
jgi:NADPH-dependent curcumin reductase CurA